MEFAPLAYGILNFAGTKLASKIIAEFGATFGVEKSLQELRQTVEEVKSVLHVAQDQSFGWLKELKDVAYDFDDLMDEVHMTAEKHKAVDGEKHVIVKYFKRNSIRFRNKMANKIKAINERFQAIVEQRKKFNSIREGLPESLPIQDRQPVPTDQPSLPFVDETTIFGRDHDKSNIIRELIRTNDREAISIISIIGLGGSGKTTLAKLIFNDENEVKKHFEVRIWVYVSEKFVKEELIKNLYEGITGKKPVRETLLSMISKIVETLRGKRYLLVLDDVWNEDRFKWDDFIVHLKGGAVGSRILLTTRTHKVAEIVKSTVPYELAVLSEDDGWKLFKQSSGRGENDWEPQLEEIGKAIVKKCGGVPLAVKSLGSILSGMEGINSWQRVRESELWDVDNRVIASLRLSYSYMPSYLQQCFLHCSIFPKGYEINKHHLIAEWIAHGFITPLNEVEQLEDVGNDHFNSLLKISFLQDLVEDKYPGIVTCKMHDVVHDLTRHILQDEIISKPEDITYDVAPRCRYLSFTECNEKINRKLFNKVRALYVAKENFTFDKPIKKARYVRTAILENIHSTSFPAFILKLQYLGYLRISHLQCEALPDAISCCWNLQALHVTYCTRLLTLPESIGKLKKLRTLDLSGGSNVEFLPQSIGGCYNLQSFHLISCKGLKEIPDSIGKNKNLRVLNLARCAKLVDLPEAVVNLKKLEVLNLERCDKLCGLPVGIGQLTCLQRLGLFVASDGKKYARISELGSLDMISGSLEIKNIMYVEGSADDEENAYLKKKKKLQRLTLEWSTSDLTEQEVGLLNGLEPPSGTVSLSISNYPGRLFSNWMMNMGGNLRHPRFPCLSEMALYDFPNLKHLAGIVELPSLKALQLQNMPSLESISGGPFPSLVELSIRKMPTLVELWTTPRTWGDQAHMSHHQQAQSSFPCLSELVVRDCPRLNVKPYLPSWLENLELMKSNEQVLVWPSVAGVRSLQIYYCDGLRQLPESMRNLTSLQSLHISGCNDLELLPEWLGELRSLQHLEIWRCTKLRQLPESMKNLVSLQHLEIRQLPALELLPESLGELRSLKNLIIMYCMKLRQLPESTKNLVSLQHLQIRELPALELLLESLGELCSLQRLEIFRCNSLSSLPQSMAGLTSLQHLRITGCDHLSSLPQSMAGLTSLQSLEIFRCPALQLPEWDWLGELKALQSFAVSTCPGIKSLPSSIQRLTSLQELKIWNCPDLEKRYRRGEGEDWRLISHIPDIHTRRG